MTWASVVNGGSAPAPNGPRNGNGSERQGKMRPRNGILNGSVRQPTSGPARCSTRGVDLKKGLLPNDTQGFPFRFATGGNAPPPLWWGTKGRDAVYKGGNDAEC